MLGTNDEFQILGDTYNKMRKSLANANEKLSEINERLEQLVDERTNDLKGLNNQLLEDIAKREGVENAFGKAKNVIVLWWRTRWMDILSANFHPENFFF